MDHMRKLGMYRDGRVYVLPTPIKKPRQCPRFFIAAMLRAPHSPTARHTHETRDRDGEREQGEQALHQCRIGITRVETPHQKTTHNEQKLRRHTLAARRYPPTPTTRKHERATRTCPTDVRTGQRV